MLKRRACARISNTAVRRTVVPHVPLRIVLTDRCSAFSKARQWHVYVYFCSHHWLGRNCKFHEFPLVHSFMLSGVLKLRHQLKVVNLHARVYSDEIVWIRSGMRVIPCTVWHGVAEFDLPFIQFTVQCVFRTYLILDSRGLLQCVILCSSMLCSIARRIAMMLDWHKVLVCWSQEHGFWLLRSQESQQTPAPVT